MSKTPQYRIRFVIDPDAEFEECNGERRPLTREEYKGNEYMQDGRKQSYAEYLSYYGNPDRHVYLQSEVQRQCPCCQVWSTVGGTGHIDFMDDAPELAAMDRWYGCAEIDRLPGYLKEIAKEDVDEAIDRG